MQTEELGKEGVKPFVVIVAPDAGGEGSVSGIVRKHAEILSNKFRVQVISGRAPVGSDIQHSIAEKRDFSWLRRFAHVPGEIDFARSVFRALKELAKLQSLDLVICHSHALAALAAWPLKKLTGIGYGIVVHADIFDRAPGTYDYRLTAFYKWVTPIAYRHADIIFAISPHMADCAVKRGGNTSNVVVVPNGIDPQDIGLREEVVCEEPSRVAGSAGHTKSGLSLLYVGRLSVEKGVSTLVDACESLASIGLPYHLDIVGDGPLREMLLQRITISKLEAKITLRGRCERRELSTYYQEADVTLVPSLSEPQGLVVLESMLAGTPVIGSDVGGIPMILKDGWNGMLVTTSDAERLASAIKTLAENRSLLQEMKDRCVDSIWPAYAWATVGELLESHVNQAICSLTIDRHNSKAL